jgi:hypothetical protein
VNEAIFICPSLTDAYFLKDKILNALEEDDEVLDENLNAVHEYSKSPVENYGTFLFQNRSNQ